MKRKIFDGTFVIADSQFLFTHALKTLLSGYGARVYTTSVKTGLHLLLENHGVSLIIADHMQLYRGAMDELVQLKKQYPGTAHLVLTGSISRQNVKELNLAGIRNIALRTDDRNEILRAVMAALNGKKHYSREVLDLLLNNGKESVEGLLLTPSEIEIINMISSRLSVEEIASRKNVSVRSVRTHRNNIFRKLGVSSSQELTMIAIREGLIDNIEYHI